MTLRAWEHAKIPNADRMPPSAYVLFGILRCHVGRDRAISMLALYEAWSAERLPRDIRGRVLADVATRSRAMRLLIDDLRDVWGVPIMSGPAGYWIIGDEKELDQVVRQFRARGMKSLATAARLKRISLADEIAQIELELRRTQ